MADALVLAGVDAVVPGAFWPRLADLAGRLDAEVRVVHVLQPTPVPAAAAFPAAGTGAPPLLVTEDLVETEQAVLARLRATVPADWAVTVERGVPGQVLLEQAEQLGAYLLVVGAPAHGAAAAVEHALTGSTARHLEKHTTVPLLVLPSVGDAQTW